MEKKYLYFQPEYVGKFKCDGAKCNARCCNMGNRKDFLDKHSTLLENYLVNELFMNRYPYRFLNENIARNFAIFLISYKIFELILFAATHEGMTSKADLLDMVDWFTTKMDHAKALHDKFFELLKGIDDIFLLMTCLLKG